MSQIRAMSIEEAIEVTSDGSDTIVPFAGHDALKDGNSWVDVSLGSVYHLQVEVGAAGCDFTVLGKITKISPAITLHAKAAQAADGSPVDSVDAFGNLGAINYLQVKEDGTNTEVQTIHLSVK